MSLDLPISRRNRDFSALGNFTLNANAEVDQLSDFGTLTKLGAGANFSPVDRLNFIASWSREGGAPSINQLGDAVIETPDTRIFDFTTGETVLVTAITGGNRDLDADRRTVWKLGGNWQPVESVDLRLRAEYVRTRIDRPTQSIFGPTAALEAAFPERFTRDANGRLLRADLRPINFDEARRQVLRIGFDFSKPLKSRQPSQSVRDQLRAQFRGGERGPRDERTQAPPEAGPPPEGGPPRDGGFGRREGRGEGAAGGGFFGGGNRGRLTFSITDTITLQDEVRIGPGAPVLDYLGGEASGAGGGTPRHKVEARAGWANNGFGARLSANWQSGTTVRSQIGDELAFLPARDDRSAPVRQPRRSTRMGAETPVAARLFGAVRGQESVRRQAKGTRFGGRHPAQLSERFARPLGPDVDAHIPQIVLAVARHMAGRARGRRAALTPRFPPGGEMCLSPPR